jgi:prepilin-type processing-associated H-X9-DG protein
MLLLFAGAAVLAAIRGAPTTPTRFAYAPPETGSGLAMPKGSQQSERHPLSFAQEESLKKALDNGNTLTYHHLKVLRFISFSESIMYVCDCPRNRAGFTVVEVLVIIAIITVLFGIGAPAVQRIRMTADKLRCANNLRQIGLAFKAFAHDKSGAWPQSTHTVPVNQAWIYALAPYLEDIDRVRISPGDPRGDERLAARQTSYTLNEYTSVPGPHECLNERRCNGLSQTIIVFTGSDARPLGTGYDHTHSREWFALPFGVWERVTGKYGIQPARFGSSFQNQGQTGAANYLYADGHVAEIRAAQIRQWCDSGFDFAKPPLN